MYSISSFLPLGHPQTHNTTMKKKKKRNIKTLLFDGYRCRNVLLLLLFKILIVCLFYSLSAWVWAGCWKNKSPVTSSAPVFWLHSRDNCKDTGIFASLPLLLQRCFLSLFRLTTQRDLNLTWTWTVNELVQRFFNRIIHLIFLMDSYISISQMTSVQKLGEKYPSAVCVMLSELHCILT